MMLTVWECTSCGKYRLPGRPICPDCTSEFWSRTALCSAGRVIAETCVHIAPGENPVFPIPYSICLVKTDEHAIHYMGASGGDLRIGLEVELLEDRSQAPYIVRKKPNAESE